MTVNCFICNADCRDYGPGYDSACGRCAQLIHEFSGGYIKLSSGDGFPTNAPGIERFGTAIERVKLMLGKKIAVPVILNQDKRCKQCNIKNDLGAKICYYCQALNPTDY
jgi:hypothetical protein